MENKLDEKSSILSAGQEIQEKHGISVFEGDKSWKTLIVLDACRFDAFKQFNHIKGKLTKKISKGSSTLEWRDANIKGDRKDTICVSANPYISNAVLDVEGLGDVFFHVEDVWDYGWDENIGSIPAQAINDAAVRLHKQYPKKRLYLHYMQPHYPYIGEHKLNDLRMLQLRQMVKTKRNDLKAGYIGNRVRSGEVSIEQIRAAYMSNLKYVFSEISKILKDLPKPIVITSDHGESFGEYGLYDHPCKTPLPHLIEVPWLIIE